MTATVFDIKKLTVKVGGELVRGYWQREAVRFSNPLDYLTLTLLPSADRKFEVGKVYDVEVSYPNLPEFCVQGRLKLLRWDTSVGGDQDCQTITYRFIQESSY